MTLVKICGINDTVAFDTVVDAGADFVGFVFFPPSPRAVTPAQAAALSARSTGGPQRVGLFVNPDDAAIADTLAYVRLDALQLHNCTIDRRDEIAARFGVAVWQAVGVTTASDLPATTHADRLLLDAKAPANATRPGGNAAVFDWSVLAGWQAPAPWMLAGGLTLDNVAAAIAATGADAVDLSSGVESAPGVKDPALIRAFIRAAKSVPSRAPLPAR
jgi:phosphoribosylanthranilate isomerase